MEEMRKSREKNHISLIFCSESHTRFSVVKVPLQWHWVGFLSPSQPKPSKDFLILHKKMEVGPRHFPFALFLVHQGPPSLTNVPVSSTSDFPALRGASGESLEDSPSKLHFPDNLFQRLITSTARNNLSSC